MWWAEPLQGLVESARFDGSNRTLVRSGLLYPYSLAVSPDCATVYVSEARLGRVVAFDATDGSNLRALSTKSVQVAELVVSPDGQYLYWADQASSALERVDAADGANLVTIVPATFMGFPWDLYLTPAGDALYWIDRQDTGRIGRVSLPPPDSPDGVAGDPEVVLDMGSFSWPLYLDASPADDTLFVYDLARPVVLRMSMAGKLLRTAVRHEDVLLLGGLSVAQAAYGDCNLESLAPGALAGAVVANDVDFGFCPIASVPPGSFNGAVVGGAVNLRHAAFATLDRGALANATISGSLVLPEALVDLRPGCMANTTVRGTVDLSHAQHLVELVPHSLSGLSCGVLLLPATLGTLHPNALAGVSIGSSLEFGATSLQTVHDGAFVDTVVEGDVLLPPGVSTSGGFRRSSIGGTVSYGVDVPLQAVWTERGAVKRAPAQVGQSSASTDVAVVADTGTATAHAVVPSADGLRVLWTLPTLARIESASLLDGTGRVTLVDASANGGAPAGLAIAPDDAFMVWTDVAAGAIWRSLLDGSEQTAVISGGLADPSSIVLSPNDAGARMFWTDTAELRSAWSSNGTDVVLVAHRQFGQIRSLTISPNGGVLYFAIDGSNDFTHIGRVDVDGTNFRALDVDRPNLRFTSIAVTADSATLLCTNSQAAEVIAVSTADGSVRGVVAAGLAMPVTGMSGVTVAQPSCGFSELVPEAFANATVQGDIAFGRCSLRQVAPGALTGATIRGTLHLDQTLITSFESGSLADVHLQAISLPPNLDTVGAFAFSNSWLGSTLDLSKTALSSMPANMLARVHLDGDLILPSGVTSMQADVLHDGTVRGTVGCDVQVAYADEQGVRVVRPWQAGDVATLLVSNGTIVRGIESVPATLLAQLLNTPLTASSAASVALVHVEGNAEGTFGALVITPPDTGFPVALQTDLRKPMDVAVHVDDITGAMAVLFTDAGSPPTIERAVLGQNEQDAIAVVARVQLVSTDLQEPIGIAILGDVVYWADSAKHTIELASALDGTGRRTLQRTG